MGVGDYLYSIVIPCYKSHVTLRKVVESTVAELEKLGISRYEFILVNDSSPDEGETIAVIKALSEEYDYVKGIDLAKNQGQHRASLIGMNYVSGDFVISMDDDMQTDPTQLKFLIEEIMKGYDIVYGYYEVKAESEFRKLGSSLNNITVRYMIGKPKWLKTSSYWIIRRFVADAVVKYKGARVHFQPLFLGITNKITCIPIKARAREHGSTGYTLKTLIKLYCNIFFFSPKLIAFIKNAGILFIIASVVLLILRFFADIPGFLISDLFFSGVTMTSLGVVGGYISGILNIVSGRDNYAIRDLYNIKKVMN